MTVKTTGAEFKAFYEDKNYWPEGAYHDDEIIEVNGEEWTEAVEDMPDDAVVKLTYGSVIFAEEDKESTDFETFFRKWRKLQTRQILMIEFDKDRLEEIKIALKDLNVKIL